MMTAICCTINSKNNIFMLSDFFYIYHHNAYLWLDWGFWGLSPGKWRSKQPKRSQWCIVFTSSKVVPISVSYPKCPAGGHGQGLWLNHRTKSRAGCSNDAHKVIERCQVSFMAFQQISTSWWPFRLRPLSHSLSVKLHTHPNLHWKSSINSFGNNSSFRSNTLRVKDKLLP